MLGHNVARIAGPFVVFAVLLGALTAAWLPWSQNWGATLEEVRRGLPGDETVPDAADAETRAITIDAPAALVWPWVAQLGQDRGGFYSYRVLENLVGCRMPDADRIHPEMQAWKPGDKLWMYPPERVGGAGSAELRVYEPGKALGFGTRQIGTPLASPPDGSWSFVVEPIGGNQARLIVRGRGAGHLPVLAGAFDALVFRAAHFTMERKMLVGIKARAEGFGPTPWANDLEVASWTALALLFAAAAIQTWRGRPPARALLSMFVAGLLFQALTFLEPGPGPSVAAAVVTALLVWAAPCPGWQRRHGLDAASRHPATS